MFYFKKNCFHYIIAATNIIHVYYYIIMYINNMCAYNQTNMVNLYYYTNDYILYDESF